MGVPMAGPKLDHPELGPKHGAVKSGPEKRSFVNIRLLNALFRARIQLMALRAGHAR